MVNHRDLDSRRGLDQSQHLSSQHMVPVRGQSGLGRAGHHVEEMEPAHCADRDHRDISASGSAERVAVTHTVIT